MKTVFLYLNIVQILFMRHLILQVHIVHLVGQLVPSCLQCEVCLAEARIHL